MKISLRKRIFAWMLKNGDAYSDKLYGSYKRNLLNDINGIVVEIGPGTGVNFQYFPKGITWIGIEPNEAFFEGLEMQAKQREIDFQVLKGDALKIPLPDNSADVVLSTLVLCSVRCPEDVLREVRRVLKPGGRLIFIEHVAAPKHTNLRRVQNLLNPLNRFFADGCNCNRETWNSLQQAGFSQLQLSQTKMKSVMALHSPHIMGYAVK